MLNRLGPTRRGLLATTAALAAPALASASDHEAREVSVLTWTAALEQLRDHIAGFVQTSGIRVRHQHIPWASYRTGALNRLAAGQVPDVLWVADTQMAEFVAAGLIAPIDDIPELTRFNDEALPFCTDTMRLGGRLFGLGYYADHMALIYNRALLSRAGIPRPPESWLELVGQSQLLQQQGLCRDPLILPLAADPWLIEVITAILASFGGQRQLAPQLVQPGPSTEPMTATLQFLHDAWHGHAVMPADSLQMTEDEVFSAFAEGSHAFTVLPSYRLPRLNDPARSTNAGGFRAALMPNGGDATGHYSQGWVRFWGMSAAAKANPPRRAAAARFIAAFGGRDWTGSYRFQRNLLLDLGLPFCARPLFDDPAVRRFVEQASGSADVLREQRARLRAKSIWAPWYGSWQAATNEVWREAIAGRVGAADAVDVVRSIWQSLERSATIVAR